MTKEELEKATGQELIEQRDYCGVDGYYGDYLNDVNAEMLKRFNRLEELEAQIEKMKKYIKACWVEENLNDYSSYITNSSDEFRDLVKELNDEVRNGR